MEKLNFRVKILMAIFGLVWLLLLVRIYEISIRNHDYYRELASKNITKKVITVPFRGNILDRNSTPVTINRLGFSIKFDAYLKPAELNFYAKKVSEFLPEISGDQILKEYAKKRSPYNHDAIEVVPFVAYEKMQRVYPFIIQSKKIMISPISKRFYPFHASASHVIGYVGASDKKDVIENLVSKYTGLIGRAGIEKQYNELLQGEISEHSVVVDSYNRVISDKKSSIQDLAHQKDLHITLDMRLQNVANEAFARAQKNGAVIVMDVQNGEILVAGSYPEYDLNDFVGGISHAKWSAMQQDLANPLLNKLVNSVYAPGSVVKMGVALALLEFGGINEATKIDAPGFIEIGGHKFRDWKPQGHGKTDVVKALRESVDVYFYRLSQQVGMTNIANVLSTMGFGKKTGVDLPNEFVGILPNPEWKMSKGLVWYVGDTVVSSIGQGSFLVTPMQIARYTALMASGTLPTPHFEKSSEVLSAQSKDVLNAFQKSKLKFIQEGMRQACGSQAGTAHRATLGARTTIACKTGTVQVVSIPQNIKIRIKEKDLPYFHRSHAWITGYVPFKNPRYSITVFIEHGESGGNAGPIMVELANALKDYGYIR